MRILVFGGAGFIGSNLVSFLKNKGIDVCVFDSLISGNLKRLSSGVPFIMGDIRDSGALARAMQDMTHIVHLAAFVSVSESMINPLIAHEVNVSGTENILNTMREIGIKRIVYASSAAVYGDEPSLPKRESCMLQPQSPYAFTKVINEMQSKMYERTFGLSPIGLRFFNVYGPGQEGNHSYSSVIPRWIEAIRKEHDIIIYGDGSQTRDFIHINDVVEAIYSALTGEVTGVYNIASGEETSLMELQKLIMKNHKKSLKVKNIPFRKGDILRSVADISAARKSLNFVPTIELSEGISKLFIS